ncbi:MAG TPA: type II secretion system F family protein [Candidatus Saccharimonadales bacterium]|nr:type II secretion system F family protein [Candidatus Saccharimonadales bacterium]
MKIQYRATTKDGQIVQGVLEAKDTQEASFFLREKEMLPLSIRPMEETKLPFSEFFQKSSNSDLVLFTRQLSSILTSGLTLMQALNILKEQVQNQKMKDVVESLINDVQEGKTFADSIAKFPKVFNPIYISLIRAAESSGFLDKVLLRLADNLEKQEKLKGTIKSALMYPVVVVTLMVVVMGVMMIFVMPQLTVLYQQLNIPLPFTTQIVVGISNFTVTFWPLVIAGIIALFIGFNRWKKTDTGELIMDSFMLKLPVFGPLIEKTILAEFSRTFGLLVSAGTLVVQSLNESADTTGNRIYKNAITEVSKRVEKGISIGDAMAAFAIFPPLIVQMVKIGEQTGKLDESLLKVSEYFEREVDGTVKTLTTAMEPFIMIVLGVGVAFLIISIITPIYNLTSNIQ